MYSSEHGLRRGMVISDVNNILDLEELEPQELILALQGYVS